MVNTIDTNFGTSDSDERRAEVNEILRRAHEEGLPAGSLSVEQLVKVNEFYPHILGLVTGEAIEHAA